MHKIGRGSYGDVYFVKDGVVAKKVDKYDRNRNNRNGIELTTLCEIAILGISDLQEFIPRLISIAKEPSAYYINMEDCGDTIGACSSEYTLQTRTQMLPSVALKLVQSCMLLAEYGIYHNDVKSSNFMMCAKGTLRIIDFGLCLFEAPCSINSELRAYSNPGFNIAPEWGTYTIMPPETYLETTWSTEYLIPWSIGITLCEFLFETHSFIRDYVLDSGFKHTYDAAYKNDSRIQSIFSELFDRKLKQGEKYLVDFASYNMFPSEIIAFMNGLLTLDYRQRTPLSKLLHCKIFNKISLHSFDVKLRAVKNTILHQKIDQPLNVASLTSYMNTRKKCFHWMFDVLLSCNKLQCFTLAVQLFDRFLSANSAPTSKYITVAAACVYISQIKSKIDGIQMSVLTKATSWFSEESSLDFQSINNCIEETVASLKYKLYFPTADMIILNQHNVLDMGILLETYIDLYPPYSNQKVFQIYKNKMLTLSQK